MRSATRALLLVLFLAIGAGATWAAYTGLGVRALGAVSVRAGSVGGPSVIGGGPRYGK